MARVSALEGSFVQTRRGLADFVEDVAPVRAFVGYFDIALSPTKRFQLQRDDKPVSLPQTAKYIPQVLWARH